MFSRLSTVTTQCSVGYQQYYTVFSKSSTGITQSSPNCPHIPQVERENFQRREAEREAAMKEEDEKRERKMAELMETMKKQQLSLEQQREEERKLRQQMDDERREQMAVMQVCAKYLSVLKFTSSCRSSSVLRVKVKTWLRESTDVQAFLPVLRCSDTSLPHKV